MSSIKGRAPLISCKNLGITNRNQFVQTRVEQVLGSQPGAITAYRILNLIQFYKITVARILGPNAALTYTLEE